ncbi:glycosyltransferase 87 family protein [Corynebacterium antarcticum]|uniref:glycosyltransferase 87 family protein n=1 Tax=Corynebacterium antarcticum TaxID=2800405 RepID=UPI002004F95F|nr:glycosyltransferase 87 family protein [Corynebacterium antarcticum]MCK7660087.1 glycosyltransferase 87 family protein [Corynebacterium antarcticum]
MSDSAPGTSSGHRFETVPVALRATALLAVIVSVIPMVFNMSRPDNGRLLRYHIDFDVYRSGGRALIDGVPLYTVSFPVGGIELPFTYPPIAAIFFAPTALVDRDLGAALMNVVSVAALWWCLVVVLDRLRPNWGPATGRTVALVLLALLLRLEPVTETLNFAQVNILLMAAVILDVLARRTRIPRGTLIGLAAAIKLTPAVFGLYFLVRRDWRSAGMCVLSGVGFTTLAWLITPANSAEYWLHTLSDPDRIGQLSYSGNQSIRGVLARIVGEGLQTPLWFLAVLTVLAAVIVAMRRAVAHGAFLGAILLNATVALLCSPVSWTHHWVWIAPVIVVLGVRALDLRGTRAGGLAFWLAASFFTAAVVAPHWTLPYRGAEEDWSPVALLVGGTYVLLAVILIGAATVAPEILGGGPGRLGSTPARLPAWPGAALAAVVAVISSGVVGGSTPGVVPNDVSQESAAVIEAVLAAGGGTAHAWPGLAVVVVLALLGLLVVVPVTGWRVVGFAAPVIMLALPVRLGLSAAPLTLLAVGLLSADAFAPRIGRLPRGVLSGVAVGLSGWPVLALGAVALRGGRRAVSVALVSGAVILVAAWPVAGPLPGLTGLPLDSALNASPAGLFARVTGSGSPLVTVVPAVVAAVFLAWVLHRLRNSGATTAEQMSAWLTVPLLVLPMVPVQRWALAAPLIVVLLMRVWSGRGSGDARIAGAAAFGAWLLVSFWPPTALESSLPGYAGGGNPLTELLALTPVLYLVVTLVLLSRGSRRITGG